MSSSKFYKYFLWFLPLSFFAFQFILRVAPGVLMQDIMLKYGVTALSFGVLSGCYYLGYSGMQIPVGMMLDKFNPRFVISFSIVLCGIGTMLFSLATSWNWVLFGRFLIGTGCAVGFLGTAKVISKVFDAKEYGMMIGLTFTVGLLGAIYGGKPLNLLHAKLGFETLTYSLAIICFVIALFIFLFLNVQNVKNEEQNEVSLLFALKTLIKDPKVIFISVLGGLMVGPLEGFADVWGISFFHQVYHMPKAEASLLVSSVFFGMCFGGPLLSYLTEKFFSPQLFIMISGVFMSLFLLVIMYNKISVPVIALFLFLTGIFCCYQVIIFSMARDMFAPAYLGMATAIINSINMSFGFLFHYVIGYTMDLKWSGQLTSEGLRLYSETSYVSSLTIIPVACIIGSLGFLLMNKIGAKDKDVAVSVK